MDESTNRALNRNTGMDRSKRGYRGERRTRGSGKFSLRFNGVFHYTGGILFHVYWCIRQLCSSSIESIIIITIIIIVA